MTDRTEEYINASDRLIDLYRKELTEKDKQIEELKAQIEKTKDCTDVELSQKETFIEFELKVNDIKIGYVELNPDKHEITRLEIYEPYQNKGYGTEVIGELIGRGYDNLCVASDNSRAIHVYEKCGFVKDSEVWMRMKLKRSVNK